MEKPQLPTNSMSLDTTKVVLLFTCPNVPIVGGEFGEDQHTTMLNFKPTPTLDNLFAKHKIMQVATRKTKIVENMFCLQTPYGEQK
jgi:hypothetical protein